MTQIINDKLVGQPLLTVYHRLRTEIPMILHRYFQTPEGMMNLFDEMLGHAFEEKSLCRWSHEFVRFWHQTRY